MTRPTYSVRILIAVLGALLCVSVLPNTGWAAARTLSLSGPQTVFVGGTATYTGELRLSSAGIPLQDVDVFLDGARIAGAKTGQSGGYQVGITFPTAGAHELYAVTHRGTLVESRSPILAIQVLVPEPEPGPSDFEESTEFLYTGPGAVQTGVVPETIVARRAAVVRGSVSNSAGNPLQGVTVKVADHAEFGETVTGPDGTYDLAINGGESVVIQLEKPGFMPLERELQTDWREFSVAPDVVMLAYDPSVTTITAGAGTAQVARATEVQDADGARRATLMFEAGTDAAMVLPSGTSQPLTTLDVRATEYTVGAQGALAMPGELPGASAYTYAVELSVDQAVAAGATKVEFTKPVSFYVENFVGFPTGTPVPIGFYDREKHAWLPADDGRVVEILSVTGGKADLDVTGDGVADSGSTLTDLGINDPELEKLASTYGVPVSLWRMETDHFSTPDLNYPGRLPAGATAPGQEEAADSLDDPCTQEGSIIGCETQTLGETIPIAGTPYHLRYDSSRAPGRVAERSLEIPLTGNQPPAPLKRVTLNVSVGGRTFTYTEAAAPNLTKVFTWDGKDVYGRVVQGRQKVSVKIGYVYDGVYQLPGQFRRSFGLPGEGAFEIPARNSFTLFQSYDKLIGGLTEKGFDDFGGWTLSSHHSYDRDTRTLELGSGGQRSGEAMLPELRTFAGSGATGSTGQGTYSGDGGSAISAGLSEIRGVAAGPDGSVYLADWTNGVVRRVSPTGMISTFAGGAVPANGNGDGGAATQAELGGPIDVAVGPDGSVYIADVERVRRVSPEGIISTFAGGGDPGLGLGDQGPATAAVLDSPHGIAVGPSGQVFIADTGNNRVRVVGADGVINTFAGGGSPVSGIGDGGTATAAKLNHPIDVAVAGDGTLYVSDRGHSRVRAVSPQGQIRTFAGTGAAHSSGDGGPATQAAVGDPTGLAISPLDSSLYITDRIQDRVRRVDQEGVITTAIGTGSGSGEGLIPLRAKLNQPQSAAFSPDGDLYVADTLSFRVRRVAPPLPGYSAGDVVVPDGDRLYQFSSIGRHIRTLDALTGTVIDKFLYNGQGRVTGIEDAYGNVTTIERDVTGKPMAIVSPFGPRTTLTPDAQGRLKVVENPAGEQVSMTYVAGGLLESFTTPSGTSNFFYDGLGRLLEDHGPDGSSTTLARTPIDGGVRVTATSAGGKTTTYKTEVLDSGVRQRTVTDPSGVSTISKASPDGSVTLTSPDGTVTSTRLGPDPRWGMAAPILASLSTATPGGKAATVSGSRSVTLSDPGNPLSLQTQTDSLTTNGKTFTRFFDAPTMSLKTTTAEGRVSTTTLNPKGRVSSVNAPGVASVNFSYDAAGRLTGSSQGSGAEARTTTVGYDANGFVNSVSDSLSESTFTNDEVGRVLASLLPDDNSIAFDYDDSGNLTSLTPPGRTAHGFDHTSGNQLETYDPPQVGGQSQPTGYVYNADRQATAVNLPGSRSIAFAYDTGGRLDTSTFSRGVIDYGYNSASQLSSISTPDGPSLGYGYDGSLLTSVVYSGAMSGTTTYGYDADLRVSSRSVNGGAATGFTYDKDGLVKTAGALGLTWSPITGMLSSTALGGTSTAYGYNSFGELETSSATHSGSALYSASYQRDQLGRIERMTESVGGTSSTYVYTYDDRGRLTDVTKDGTAVEHYVYDANGNRTSATTSAGTVSGTYDARDRMESYGAATYTYRASGELATKTTPGGTTAYDYDELGSLTHVELPSGDDVNYNVDGLGRRVTRKVNGTVTTRFQYGTGLLPVAELDAAGNTVSTFVYASRSNVPDYMIKGGVNYRFVTDHVGSVRMVVNAATGAVAQRIDYDSFGKVLSDTNPGFQPFAFAGGLYDTATGLTRFGARDYDAETGRWTARDPLLFAAGDTNLYAYVFSDPVNFIDPSGLFFGVLQSAFGDVGAAFSNFVGGVSAAVGGVLQEAGCLLGAAGQFVMTRDWGSALAAGTNVLWGAAKIVGGATALITGVAATVILTPLIGAVVAVPVAAYGAYQLATGVARLAKGAAQAVNGLETGYQCQRDCDLRGNGERFGRGIIPGGSAGWELLGGAP